MKEQLALVVGRAACTQHVALDGRIERIELPQLQRVYGLHVVVPVDEHDRRIGVVAAPLGVDRGHPGGRPDLDGREAGAAGGVGEPVGAAQHVGVVLGLGADAGDPQPLVEVGEQVLAVFGHVGAFVAHAIGR
jgi:hypothetical protein